ncbi:hypothetical protein [Chryseobacterium vrystaatense]|uniref:Uncharacterized protein n=1 Tax=Chryseobacterium vrystaatense TaxID=307480 RepID=A0A1M4ZT00_9FLAO|nr:hypothetical protein [Chryseobacterium vrystaatense]SHF21134.1 hypothetical protein SAMN02787073_1692 [Chryseobacterium vrystaatense]
MYENFLTILNEYSSQGHIEILHRGLDKGYAFKKFNLNTDYNSIEQFGERLFFFGEKSKYFEIEKYDLEIKLDNISKTIFEKLFDILSNLDFDSISPLFYENNKDVCRYFSVNNQEEFIQNIMSLDKKCRTYMRNYYSSILHQLDNNDLKKESFFVSSSSEFSQANNYSLGKKGIVINFWNWKSKEHKCNFDNIPYFDGVPFPNENETSVFGAIFPHYIYSFEHDGQLYINPALFDEKELEIILYTGFEIDQTDFKNKLQKMTSYKSYLENDNDQFTEKNL